MKQMRLVAPLSCHLILNEGVSVSLTFFAHLIVQLIFGAQSSLECVIIEENKKMEIICLHMCTLFWCNSFLPIMFY